MNIKKLRIGMIIKNYKLLCEVIEIEFKEGTCSRKSQLKELERYVKFHKEGQKFFIDEIYKEVKEKMDKRGGNNKVNYIPYIEKLILDLLVQSYHKETVCLSKNKLFKELKMTNENYAFCKTKNRIPKLSKFTGIQQETIDEWYASTDSTLKGNIEKALNNLKNQSLIFWSNEISVCKMEVQSMNGKYDINKKVTLDEYNEEVVRFKVNAYTSPNFREGTDSEKKFIIHTERDIMLGMGFKNKADIVKCGMWNIFKEKIDKIILKELNIDYYYNSYRILFNQDHILQKYEEFIDDLLLSKEERNETQQLLNIAVTERLNVNVKKKQNRALEETKNMFGKIKDEKLNRRIKSTYVSDNNKLVTTLVDSKSEIIKNKIKKIKIEKPTNSKLSI